MATSQGRTTLVCLFHHKDQAEAAVRDLTKAGIPETLISYSGNFEAAGISNVSIDELGIPERDRKHLLQGLDDGGVLIAVDASQDQVQNVESVFGDNRAKQIDEADLAETEAVSTIPVGERTIPIVEEELAVGKRTVDQGGVRVYRRIVEIPVDQTVELREEHVIVERHPVDRAVTDADLSLQGDRTIELTETAEEAVVSKNARVIEEIHVDKSATERTEHIRDTVRKTEVDVEEVLPDATRRP